MEPISGPLAGAHTFSVQGSAEVTPPVLLQKKDPTQIAAPIFGNVAISTHAFGASAATDIAGSERVRAYISHTFLG